MVDVALLRAKALAYRPDFKLAVCLDEELREAIDKAVEKLTELHAEQQQAKEHKESGRRTIADPDTKDIWATKISEAEAEVEAAEQAAAGDSVVIVWQRQSPDVYQQVLDDTLAAHDGEFNFVQIADALLSRAYTRCTATTGDDLDMTWQDAKALLSHADYDVARAGVVTLHRADTGMDPTRLTTSGKSKQI